MGILSASFGVDGCFSLPTFGIRLHDVPITSLFRMVHLGCGGAVDAYRR